MRRSVLVSCIVLTSVLLASAGLAALPMADEILEIHQANQEPLSSLHLRWTHVEERTDASGRADRQRAEEKARLTRDVHQSNSKDLRIEVGNQTFVGEAALRLLEQGGAILSRR
jgi:hypothetical protein